MLILTVLLLLLSMGCAHVPDWESTDMTDSSTQSQPESRPQESQLQDATEPTQTSSVQQTQPTQNNDAHDNPQDTQEPDEPLPEQTPDTTVSATQPQGMSPGTDGNNCKHEYQQTYTKAATCTAAGNKKFTCIKCGAVTYEQIPIKDHSYQAASCLTPKTCTGCSRREGAALGHSFGANHLCIRCGAKDPDVSPDSIPVDFVATIRSDESMPLSGVTVTVYTEASGMSSVGSAVTDQKGRVTIALRAGSSKYTVVLSNVPEGYQAQESYSFSSAQVTINLKTLPVRSDPNDHSKARYEEGDSMMEFSVTDVDGRTYMLSELLKENKLVILDFWYVSCNPCKKEFPYFQKALETYGNDIVLLAIDPFYSAADIIELRDELGLSFPVFQDPLGLSGGFRVESYPTTVFIDSTGTIRKIHRKAFRDEAAFLNAIAAYM